MNPTFVILLVSIFGVSSSSQSNPGHLKPFGSTGSLISIRELDREYPSVVKFFTDHLVKSEPFLSRQVLVHDPHYELWKSDQLLESEVPELSQTTVFVQSYREPDRSQMTFGDFLRQYKRQPIYLADDLPGVLRKYLVVPQPLQCEAVLPTLQSVMLVMNERNISPLMLATEYDHLFCLFRGNKRLVLVNAQQYPDVRQIVAPETRQSHGPPLNPDRVDLNQFPALANIDYHVANISSGDCLFIPTGWVFQERSLESTVTIIYNIHHKRAGNVDGSELQTCSSTTLYDPTFTLDQVDWSMHDQEPQNLKELMINLVNSTSNNFEQWQETFSKYFSFDISADPEVSSVFEEFYGIVDVDGDGQITNAEIEQITGAHQHHISDILYEIIKSIDGRQQKTAPKKETNEGEDLSRTIDEDQDEHLHLQSYKTDL